MVPKSMSSVVENIELKSKEKITRTNSICPCFYFSLINLTFIRSYTTLMQVSAVILINKL